MWGNGCTHYHLAQHRVDLRVLVLDEERYQTNRQHSTRTQYIQLRGNGCTHYHLAQHWVDLRVLAEEGPRTGNTLLEHSMYSCGEMVAHANVSPNTG